MTTHEPVHEQARRILESDLPEHVPGTEPEPVRSINASMAGEDWRALIGRLLVFAATERDAGLLNHVRLAFTKHWVIGTAGDGYAIAIQKMRCESDGEGVLHLSAYDAARAASIVPKPGKDEWLDDVALFFQVGGDEKTSLRVTASFEQHGRQGFYSCSAEHSGPTDPAALVKRVLGAAEPLARVAINPDRLVQVAKAAAIARDQQPLLVRWYVSGELKNTAGDPVAGPLIARFSAEPEHDDFVALLMSFGVDWTPDDRVERALTSVISSRGAGRRFHPKPASFTDGAAA